MLYISVPILTQLFFCGINGHTALLFAIPHSKTVGIHDYQEFSICAVFIKDTPNFCPLGGQYLSTLPEYRVLDGKSPFKTIDYQRKLQVSNHQIGMTIRKGTICTYTQLADFDPIRFVFDSHATYEVKIRLINSGLIDVATQAMFRFAVENRTHDIPKDDLRRLYDIFYDHSHDTIDESLGEQIVFLKKMLKVIRSESLLKRTQYTLDIKNIAFRNTVMQDYEFYQKKYKDIFQDENILKIELLHAAFEANNLKQFDKIPINNGIKYYPLYGKALEKREMFK